MAIGQGPVKAEKAKGNWNKTFMPRKLFPFGQGPKIRHQF